MSTSPATPGIFLGISSTITHLPRQFFLVINTSERGRTHYTVYTAVANGKTHFGHTIYQHGSGMIDKSIYDFLGPMGEMKGLGRLLDVKLPIDTVLEIIKQAAEKVKATNSRKYVCDLLAELTYEQGVTESESYLKACEYTDAGVLPRALR